MVHKILVPLDGSTPSEEVLPLACMLAKGYQAELVLLRVVEYPYNLYSMCYEYPPSDPEMVESIQKRKTAILDEGKIYLKQVASRLATDEIQITSEVCEGPVVEAIMASIARLHVDLIALSTCGQSGCSRCSLGAIADRVLREAPVSVVMARPSVCSTAPTLSLRYQMAE